MGRHDLLQTQDGILPIDAGHPRQYQVNSPKRKESLFLRLGGRDRLIVLLRHFHADVRQQALIGPIFNRQIQDWPVHLEKITDFWLTVTGGPLRYSGPMPMKHLPLGLDVAHFDSWLDLWRRHCRAHVSGPEAEELIAAAGSIGGRIRWAIDRPGLIAAKTGAAPNES